MDNERKILHSKNKIQDIWKIINEHRGSNKPKASLLQNVKKGHNKTQTLNTVNNTFVNMCPKKMNY